MSLTVNDKDLGPATAYGYALTKGYTGTEEEFAELMASYATVAEIAVDAKDDAVAAKNTAVDAKDDAVAAKNAAVLAKADAIDAKDTAVSKAGEASSSASDANTDALKAEGYAVGKQNDSNVGSSSPYYHNNAKYYNEQSENKATIAAQAATSASSNALKSEGYAVGKQDTVDVGSDSPYYHNNAKYYAEQVGDISNSVASVFSNSVAYSAGAYVFYEGSLYVFTVDHAAGVWIGTDAVAVKLADEVSDLKSSITEETAIDLTSVQKSVVAIDMAASKLIASGSQRSVIIPAKGIKSFAVECSVESTKRVGFIDSGSVNQTVYNAAEYTGTLKAIAVNSGDHKYMIVQVFTSNDTIKDIATYIAALSVSTLSAVDDVARAGVQDNEDAVDYIDDILDGIFENIFDSATYTEWGTTTFISAGKVQSSDGQTTARVIAVPIDGSSDCDYLIRKKIKTTMRVGTGTVATPEVGASVNVYATASSVDTMTVHTPIGDTYLYIQLFASGDNSSVSENVRTLKVYKAAPTVPVRALPYNGAPIIEINHRGYNSMAPENTIPAFQESVRQGYSWIECDVQVTADDVPVVCHDNAINRTARNADGTEIEETILIGDTDYEDLLDYVFCGDMYSEYPTVKIPTLAETMDFARKSGLGVAIELKKNTVTASNIQYIISTIMNYGMESYVELFSTDPPTAKLIAKTVKGWCIGYSTTETPTADDIVTVCALRINSNTVRFHCSPTTDATANGYLDVLNAAGFEFVFRGHTDAQIANAPSYAHIFISNSLHPKTVLYNEAMGIVGE